MTLHSDLIFFKCEISIKRNQKHASMLAPTGYAHVYWFNTGLSFILSGCVCYPPEYTITTLLLYEWISVRLTAGLVPLSGPLPFQPQANVPTRTRSAEQIAGATFTEAFRSWAPFLLWEL